MNATIITGWIAAVLLIFNFGTCLIMPWARVNLEENKGKPCDGKRCHSVVLGSYHKPIVFLAIIAVIVHIVLSLI